MGRPWGEVFSIIWNIGKTRHPANNSIVLDENKSTNVGEFLHKFTFHLLIRKRKKEEKKKEEEGKKRRKAGWTEGGKEGSICLGFSLDIFKIDLDFS